MTAYVRRALGWIGGLVGIEAVNANPRCQVQIKRRDMKMQARTAAPEERAQLWPKLVAHYSGYAKYQARTERVIPVVILEPVKFGHSYLLTNRQQEAYSPFYGPRP